MNIISLNCPKCGAALEISDEIDVFYCTYCGQKIVTNDKQRMVLLNVTANIIERMITTMIRLIRLFTLTRKRQKRNII